MAIGSGFMLQRFLPVDISGDEVLDAVMPYTGNYHPVLYYVTRDVTQGGRWTYRGLHTLAALADQSFSPDNDDPVLAVSLIESAYPPGHRLEGEH